MIVDDSVNLGYRCESFFNWLRNSGHMTIDHLEEGKGYGFQHPREMDSVLNALYF